MLGLTRTAYMFERKEARQEVPDDSPAKPDTVAGRPCRKWHRQRHPPRFGALLCVHGAHRGREIGFSAIVDRPWGVGASAELAICELTYSYASRIAAL